MNAMDPLVRMPSKRYNNNVFLFLTWPLFFPGFIVCIGFVQCSVPCQDNNETTLIWELTPEMRPTVDHETLCVINNDNADSNTNKSPYPLCPLCGKIARPNVSMASDTQDTWVANRSENQKMRFVSPRSTVYLACNTEHLTIIIKIIKTNAGYCDGWIKCWDDESP